MDKTIPITGVRKSSWDRILRSNYLTNEEKILLTSLSQNFVLVSGKSFTPSPIKPLVESIIDQSLRAAELVRSGGNFFGKRNASLEFKEAIPAGKGRIDSPWTNEEYHKPSSYGEMIPSADVLGNPKQFKWTPPDVQVFDEAFARELVNFSTWLSDYLRGFSGLPYMGRRKTMKQSRQKRLNKAQHFYNMRHNRRSR